MSSWRRTYWVVWTANLITSIGMMSFLPFFPSLLEELGVEDPAAVATWAGLIFGAAPLSATLMSPVWGSLGDRVGRKLMIVRSMLAIALFVGCMAFATSPLQLLLLRIGQGLFSGFIPPSITLVSVLAPPERQGRIAGDLGTALPLGAMLGPLVGGMIAATYGHSSVFFFVAGAALMAFVLVTCLAQEDASQRQRVEGKLSISSVLAGTVRDQRAVWRSPELRGGLVLVFFLQFGLGGTNPILELYVRELAPGADFESGLWGRLARLLPATAQDGGALALATSLLFTGMALANLLAMPFWGRSGDAFGHKRALSAVGVGVVLSLLVQAAAPLYWVLFMGRILMGLSLAGAGPVAFGLAAAEVPVDRRGGAMGAVFSARTLSVALGGGLGGYLASHIGIRGFMLLAALLVALALVRFRRGQGANPSRAPAPASSRPIR